MFDNGQREEAYEYLASTISNDSPASSIHEQSLSDVDFDKLFQHLLHDLLETQQDYQMKRCALEVLSWIFSSDFLAHIDSLKESLTSMDSVQAAAIAICEIIASSNEEITCFALFFVSEQCIPTLFEPLADKLAKVLLTSLSQQSPRVVRLYAYRAMANALSSLDKWIMTNDITHAVKAIDLIGDWKCDDSKLRSAALSLGEACIARDCLPNFIPDASQQTKHLMQYLW